MIGKTYFERGQPAGVLARRNGEGPRNKAVTKPERQLTRRAFLRKQVTFRRS